MDSGRNDRGIGCALGAALLLTACLPSGDAPDEAGGPAETDRFIDWPTGADAFVTGRPSLRLGGAIYLGGSNCSSAPPAPAMIWRNLTTGDSGFADGEMTSTSGYNHLTGERWCSYSATWVGVVPLVEGDNRIRVEEQRRFEWQQPGPYDDIVVTHVPGDPAPEVRITEPTAGEAHAHASSRLVLRGEVGPGWSADAVRGSNPDSGWSAQALVRDERWSLEVTLAPGSNRVWVTARDGAGNEATDMLQVEYTPPP